MNGITLEMVEGQHHRREVHMGRGEPGHTLTEFMVVVAIITTLGMIALPNFLGLNSRAQMRCTTEEIASELRLARQLAIVRRDRVRLVMNRDERMLTTQLVTGETVHHIYRYGDRGLEIEEPSAGPEIVFQPSGRSATATTIQLRSKEGQVQRLTVSLTGRVSIL